MKKNQGITLIALVVTIIVLIILAGVSISLVMGENGIITKAREAKEKNERAADKESISLAVVSSQMKDNSGSMVIVHDNLDKGLEEQFRQEQKYTTTDNGDGTFFIKLDDKDRLFYIKINGAIIESDEFIKISTVEELKQFRDNVNNGNSYEGKYVYLANDITLDINEEWEPIGLLVDDKVSTSNSFRGDFDGCGYTIDGIRLTTSNYETQGLFGLVYNGIVKNLKIGENCIITGQALHTGAVAGFIYNKSVIYNCNNNSNITCNNLEVGGIIGTVNKNATISKCYNTGNITGKTMVGGIVGNNMTGVIKDCYNIGNITGTVEQMAFLNFCVGGIVGQHINQAKVLNCYNTGEINSRDAAGIVGNISTESSIENCYNVGIVANSQTGEYIAGIVNYINETKGKNSINNTYYLENVVNQGNDTKNVNGISHKTSEEMKNIHNLLGIAFKADTNNINNGYPILSWQ